MRAITFIVCLCALVLTFGCGGDGGGPSDTAASLTAAGWAMFEKGEFEQAIDKFMQALGLDDEYADAYNGLGWSHAKLDSLRNSLDSFGECIDLDNSLADPFAGCAAVYRDYKVHPDSTAEFDSALVAASTALAMDGSYSFDHDTSFNWQDLHLIMAQSYYGLGEFLLAKGQVDALGGHSLDPESPTFVEDLAAEIERLEGLYGG